MDIRAHVAVRPADYPHDNVALHIHRPPAMSRHTLFLAEFKVMYRLLRQDPRVRAAHPHDLRLFLHGVLYLTRTGIPDSVTDALDRAQGEVSALFA